MKTWPLTKHWTFVQKYDWSSKTPGLFITNCIAAVSAQLVVSRK